MYQSLIALYNTYAIYQIYMNTNSKKKNSTKLVFLAKKIKK